MAAGVASWEVVSQVDGRGVMREVSCWGVERKGYEEGATEGGREGLKKEVGWMMKEAVEVAGLVKKSREEAG